MYDKELSVITIGGATQDTFVIYDNPQITKTKNPQGECSYIMLEQGSKVEVKHLENHIGGGATNSAVAFKRLGFKVSTFFKIGRDKAGEFILHGLAQEGVNLDSVVYDAKHETGIAFILPFPSGDRTILVYRGANCYITEQEVPWHKIRTSSIVYITSLNGDSAKLFLSIVHAAKEHQALVVVNPGSAQLMQDFKIFKEALGLIDILHVNSDEARLCMQGLQKPTAELHTWLAEFMVSVLDLGPRMVTVTDGAHGAYAADKNGIYFHPSLPTTIANTLGAGDAFGSCFTASIVQKKSVPEALVRGIINSTSVIGHVVTKIGLLNQQELDTKFATQGTQQVKMFDFGEKLKK